MICVDLDHFFSLDHQSRGLINDYCKKLLMIILTHDQRWVSWNFQPMVALELETSFSFELFGINRKVYFKPMTFDNHIEIWSLSIVNRNKKRFKSLQKSCLEHYKLGYWERIPSEGFEFDLFSCQTKRHQWHLQSNMTTTCVKCHCQAFNRSLLCHQTITTM